MSKLAKLLLAKKGDRVAIPVSTSSIRVEQEIAPIPIAEAYVFKIGATFEVRAQCFRKDLADTTAAARRHIIEDVFGEFRAPIQGIYEKLFDRDIEGAMTALAALEAQMFGDTE